MRRGSAFADRFYEADHLRGCHFHEDHECPCATPVDGAPCGHHEDYHVPSVSEPSRPCFVLRKDRPGSPLCGCPGYSRSDECDGECSCADLAEEPEGDRL